MGREIRRMDPCSFTNSDVFRTTDAHFIWQINFDDGILVGSVELKCTVLKASTTFILDTRFLNIQDIKVNGKVANFSIGEFHPAKGRALTITAPEEIEAGSCWIQINYTTTENCTALQWLTPAQTCGGTR